jgi:hypothetical protein
MGLFRKSEERVAQDAAAEEEFDRLCALPPADLAAAVMPAFAPDGPGHGKTVNVLQIQSWLMSSFSHASGYSGKLRDPVSEAVQALSNAGLAERTGPHGDLVKTTRLGEAALADGTVARQLAG